MVRHIVPTSSSTSSASSSRKGPGEGGERRQKREREKCKNIRMKNENGGCSEEICVSATLLLTLPSVLLSFFSLTGDYTLSESYRSSTCRVSHGTELLCARVCRKAPSCG